MKQTLPQLDRLILIGAVRDLEVLRAGKRIPGCDHTDTHFRWQAAMQDAVAGLVRLDAARWLGRTPETGAERMAVSRAYARLESRGLVERVSLCDGLKCSALAPLPAGVELAKQLESEAAGT